MSTMNDIAKLAGVSQGTVSNVLNNRGNVSAKKIKLVQDAARQVGYIMNAPAHQLRSSSVLSKTVGVILPDITDAKYAALYSAMQSFWQNRGYQVSLWITNDTPYYEKEAIAAATAARVSGILSITFLKEPNASYQTIRQYGGHVIYVEREEPDACPYIGFDYEKAGYEMAGRILALGYHSALLVLGLSFFSNELLFEHGFSKRIAEKNAADFHWSTCRTNLSTAFQSAFQLFENGVFPDCIVLSGKSLHEQTAQALTEKFSCPLPPMLSLTTSRLEAQCNPDCYCMDYSVLSTEASRMLLAAFEGNKDPQTCIRLTGGGFIPRRRPSYSSAHGISLHVLLPQGQSAAAIMEMTPRFTQETKIEINYVTLPLEELTTVLSQMNGNHFFDVIRTNITTTPRFPEGVLRPIPTELFQSLTASMYPAIVQSFSYSQGQACAVPFDIALSFYAYREDLFSDPVVMRTYFETYNRSLALPEDFDTFNQIAAFFCRSHNPDSPVPYGTTGPSNDMALIFTHFLLIYRNLGGRLADTDGHFCFDRDLALRAIRLQIELIPWSLSFQSSRRDFGVSNFIEGKTALEIVSTSHASRLLELKRSSISGVLGVGSLPACTSTFGGGSLAIPVGSRQPQAAEAYIQWACGYEQAYLFTLLGGTTPHRQIYSEYDILDLYPWFRIMDEGIQDAYPHPELDIFDRYQLERFMGFTLRNIYLGVIPLEHCLDVLEQGMRSYLVGDLSEYSH